MKNNYVICFVVMLDTDFNAGPPLNNFGLLNNTSAFSLGTRSGELRMINSSKDVN